MPVYSLDSLSQKLELDLTAKCCRRIHGTGYSRTIDTVSTHRKLYKDCLFLRHMSLHACSHLWQCSNRKPDISPLMCTGMTCKVHAADSILDATRLLVCKIQCPCSGQSITCLLCCTLNTMTVLKQSLDTASNVLSQFQLQY